MNAARPLKSRVAMMLLGAGVLVTLGFLHRYITSGGMSARQGGSSTSAIARAVTGSTGAGAPRPGPEHENRLERARDDLLALNRIALFAIHYLRIVIPRPKAEGSV
jgi:hypothetical protein